MIMKLWRENTHQAWTTIISDKIQQHFHDFFLWSHPYTLKIMQQQQQQEE